MRSLLAPLPVLLLASGCAAGIGPELEPIDPQTVAVNQTASVVLQVRNGEGSDHHFSFAGPPGTPLYGTAELTPDGEFRWTPLASHIGAQTFSFALLDPGGTTLDRERTEIVVVPDPRSAPVFVRPGPGDVWDLAATPCIDFHVEVRDDDSPRVTIRERSPLWDGAVLFQESPTRAYFDWCPTAAQTAAAGRWTVELEADDGTQRTQHDYAIVLAARSP